MARYSPPQSGIIHFQSDADGQLSLLDFKVQSEPEPPDLDDFESLDAFREAIARWDTENPELVAASIDSMCEWAPCPEQWYWPKAEILPLKASSTIDLSLPSEQCEVMELSIAGESSITCNFFIPTFDSGVRSVQQKRRTARHRDIRPAAQAKAQLSSDRRQPNRIPIAYQTQPKLNPNSTQTQPNCIPKLSRNYPETIPKLFHRIAAGSSTQSARSPPGGDA